MILSIMRVKNEQRFIRRVLESQMPIVDRLILLDDNSSDDTVQIAESFDRVTVFRSPFKGTEEVRDKNFLMERLEEVAQPGDWVVACDGDEEIKRGGCEVIKRIAEQRVGPDSYQFQVLYLWNSEKQVRTDGVYGNFYRPSLFRLRRGARFHSGAGGGFHCGNVPAPISTDRCAVKLLHYGYMLKDDRIRKYHWYNAPDKQPIPAIEDAYKHIIVGDLLPATTKTRWAGPLELSPL